MFVVNASAYYSNNKRRLFIVITCNNRKEKLLENMKSSNKIVCLLILRDRSESILYAKYILKNMQLQTNKANSIERRIKFSNIYLSGKEPKSSTIYQKSFKV